MIESKAIEFKIAGGVAAQTLALINAISIKNRTGRNFQFRYFPHSTGTYWPFGIEFLLSPNEVLEREAFIRGINKDEVFQVGHIIRSHPLEVSRFSYEHLLKLLRHSGLDYYLRRIKKEVQLEAKPDRLLKVNTGTKIVSGGYVPIYEPSVMQEMDSRFRQTKNGNSPFSKSPSTTEPYAAIHFRIGDKRTKFSIEKDFGGDGISNPAVFKEILNSLGRNVPRKIYVVSDEPNVALGLLQEVGIKAQLFPTRHDIWNDLFYLSQAHIFIGSWSQVSQLAAICVAHNSGTSYLPSTTQENTQINWSIPRTTFYQPDYLPANHPIYKETFELEQDAHQGYWNLNTENES